MTSTSAAIPSATVITDQSQANALLAKAAGSRCLALTGGECHTLGGENGIRDEATLAARLRDLARRSADSWHPLALDILGAEHVAAMGHAPRWMSVGEVYEDLLLLLEKGGPASYIFCLDPWSAQLLSRLHESCPDAQWVLVSDLAGRRKESAGEYWEDLEDWFNALPASAILPLELLTTLPGRGGQGSLSGPTSPSGPETLSERPAAWRWQVVKRSSPDAALSAQASVLFVSPFSGSLPHLRIFLDALSRQNFPHPGLGLLILARDHSRELDSYLRWYSVVHPKLHVERFIALTDDGDPWKPEIARLLLGRSEGPILWIHDHFLLPEDFAQIAARADREGIGFRLASWTLELDVSARILLGAIDPIRDYAKLALSFRKQSVKGDQEPPEDHGFMIPSERGKARVDTFLVRAETFFRKEGSSGDSDLPRGSSSVDLLRLGDLP